MKVGILSIQGDFSLHQKALNKLSVNSILVKSLNDLNECESLIIPGGESTVISLLLDKYNLYNSIKDFATKKTIFGTCAGSILLSRSSYDEKVNNLNCIDLDTKRNAYGSQVDSFSDYIKFKNKNFYATFIRAPKFTNLGKQCTILATYKHEPVLVRNKLHLLSSFHPEIGNDLRIYDYFIQMINE